MLGGDISNESPPTCLVHHSVFLHQTRGRRGKPVWSEDILVLNWLYRRSFDLGLNLRALVFSEEKVPKLEDFLSFNPFSGTDTFGSRDDLSRFMAYRPDIVEIFDTVQVGAYGSRSRVLDRNRWAVV